MKCFKNVWAVLSLFLLSLLVSAQNMEQYSFTVETISGTRQAYTIDLSGSKFHYCSKEENDEAFRQASVNFDKNTALNILFQSSKKYNIERYQNVLMELDLTKSCRIIRMRLLVPLPDDGYGNNLSKEECVEMIQLLEKSKLFHPWDNNAQTIRVYVYFKSSEVKEAIAAYKASRHDN